MMTVKKLGDFKLRSKWFGGLALVGLLVAGWLLVAPSGKGTAENAGPVEVSQATGSGFPEAEAALVLKRLEEAIRKLDQGEPGAVIREIFQQVDRSTLLAIREPLEMRSVARLEEVDSERDWILAHELHRRWGELAPVEALDYLEKNESYWAGLPEAVWFGWAEADPDGAVAAYHPELEDQYSSAIREAVLEGLSANSAVKALRFEDRVKDWNGSIFRNAGWEEFLPGNPIGRDFLEYRSVQPPGEPLGLALYEWFRTDPEGAVTELLTLENPRLQEETMAALFSGWMLRDPVAALRAVGEVEDLYLRERTVHEAMRTYLLKEPEAALKAILELPAFEDEAEESQGMFGLEDEDRPLPWRYCDTTPYRPFGKMSLISDAGASLGIAEGRGAWEVAMRIEDENKRAAALGGALAGWLSVDSVVAAEFVADGIREETLLKPGGKSFPNYAVRVTSKVLALEDFSRAIKWVEALPGGPLREAGIAVSAVTRLDEAWDLALKEASPDGWVKPDLFLAAQKKGYAPIGEWLLTLPPSEGRDQAIYRLAAELSDHPDPRPALDWAVRISEERLRRIAFGWVEHDLIRREEKASEEGKLLVEKWLEENPGFAAEFREEAEREKAERAEVLKD